MNADTVGVVICCYTEDRWQELLAAIASIRAQDRPADQVVVVVDGSARLARRLRAAVHDADIVELAARSGLSAARNAGVDACRCDLVAFLDDDAVADRAWLARLAAALAQPGVGGAGGRSNPRWAAGRPAWFPEALLWTVGCTYSGAPDAPGPVRNVFGGCACYRRSLFDRVGGFRTDLGRQAKGAGGAEETEWCVRAARMVPDVGFWFEPGAVIEHLVPRPRATLAYVVRRSFEEGLAKAVLVRLAGIGVLSTEGDYLRGLTDHLSPAPGSQRLVHAVVTALSVLAAGAGLAVGLVRLRPASSPPASLPVANAA